MAVFALVFLAPIAYSIYLSLFRDQLVGGTSFVGLDNYQQAFEDAQFWAALGRVALFLVVQVPIMLGLALLVALALDSGRLYGKSFFRISIFLPYAVPAVVATLMWGFMYGTRFGLVGNINDAFGVTLPDPLSPDLVLGAHRQHRHLGVRRLQHADLLLGAAGRPARPSTRRRRSTAPGSARIITAIKLPAIRGALVIATIFSIIGSFQLFNEPSILQKLAPNAITTYFTPNFYAYSLSFSGQQHNYSATVAIIMGVDHDGHRLRRAAARHAQGGVRPMSSPVLRRRADTPAYHPPRPARPAAHARTPLAGQPRRSVLLTVLTGLIAALRLVPLVWLVINATKTQEGLFGSFGLWFGGDFALWDNIRADAHLRRRHLRPLAAQHPAVRGASAPAAPPSWPSSAATAWPSSTSPASAPSSPSSSARSPCPAPRWRCPPS